MIMSSKKAIQINPEYFNLKKNRTLKKEPREKKVKNKTGKQQKKELLRRLKEIQENKHKPNREVTDTVKTNTVDTSIDFLNTLSNEHKSRTKPELVMNPALVEKPELVAKPNIEGILIKQEPPYSNLKGSKKPSYREWLKSNDNKLKIEDNDIPKPALVKESEREQKLKKIQKKYKKQNRRARTIKIPETFGKRNGKVGVYIKNKDNKQQLENEKKTLKKQTIPKIKSYLKEHNLLKIGSYAPNDVIREIYENSMLSGDITNNNKDILVHNFLEN